MIETHDYLDVDARRAELGLVFGAGAVFLPRHFEDAKSQDELANETDALDLRKLLHEQGVEVGLARLGDESLPLIVENDAFVHLPDLLLDAARVGAVSIILNVISNYVYDRLVGSFSEPKVKLSIVRRSARGSYKRISYTGPVEGLRELQEAIENVADGDD